MVKTAELSGSGRGKGNGLRAGHHQGQEENKRS